MIRLTLPANLKKKSLCSKPKRESKIELKLLQCNNSNAVQDCASDTESKV